MINSNNENVIENTDAKVTENIDTRTFVVWTSIIFAIIAATYFIAISRNAHNLPTVENTEYTKSFTMAEELLQKGEVEPARDSYLKALESATNSNETNRALYKLAITEIQDKPILAIERLKTVAADESADRHERAYAVQLLGLLYYRNSDPALIPIIFAGEPYADFYKEGDTFLALRRLFDYSATFHPLAVAELRSALWYSQEVKDASITEEKNEQMIDSYVAIIDKKIANADADIERTKNIEGASDLIPEALYLKAVILARLNQSGFQKNYEEAMQIALNSALATLIVGKDGSPRYAYAMNLFLYEENREADVQRLLLPMIENIDAYPPFKRMFERERNNVLNQKSDLIKLANGMPEFKSLLISLNWQESDFR